MSKLKQVFFSSVVIDFKMTSGRQKTIFTFINKVPAKRRILI